MHLIKCNISKWIKLWIQLQWLSSDIPVLLWNIICESEFAIEKKNTVYHDLEENEIVGCMQITKFSFSLNNKQIILVILMNH